MNRADSHKEPKSRHADTRKFCSPALKASGLVWDAATLDRWLTGPPELVPGTKMYFSLSDPQKRADIIAYLQLQK